MAVRETPCANGAVEEQAIACSPRLVVSAAAVSKCYQPCVAAWVKVLNAE